MSIYRQLRYVSTLTIKYMPRNISSREEETPGTETHVCEECGRDHEEDNGEVVNDYHYCDDCFDEWWREKDGVKNES